MKLFKFGLRIWITVTSIFAFLVSWVMFSHSPKPVSWSAGNAAVSALPALDPLPPIQGVSDGGGPGNIFSVQQNPTVFQPRRRSIFVTGGS